MAVRYWDIESFEPPFKSWLTYETTTRNIVEQDPALATLGNPFVGTTTDEFLSWFRMWYVNNRVREFADPFPTGPTA